jgi:[ribosomal protein S5]-alanine N-acetyltransferase
MKGITMVKLDLPTQIFTPRLILRQLRYEEAEEIFYTYAGKEEATRFMSWPTHRTLEDTKAFLRYAISGWVTGTDYTYAIRTHGGRFIGSFGIINENGKLQFGYILSPTQWGRGYATEACKSMMSILREQKGVVSIQTFTDAENKASANVLLKSGLIEEGRLSNWFRFINQNNQVKDCISFRLPM